MASQGDPAGPALMEPISTEPGRGHIDGRHGCKVGKPSEAMSRKKRATDVNGCQWMSDIWSIFAQTDTGW